MVIAGPKTDLLPAEVDALRAYLRRGGKLHLLLDPPDKGTAPQTVNLIALAKEWGIDVGNNLVVDASGLGQMLGTDASVPIAMPVRHPITEKFNLMTAFPLARSVTPIEGGTEGHTAQKFLADEPAELGRDRHRRPLRHGSAGTKRRQGRPGRSSEHRRGRLGAPAAATRRAGSAAAGRRCPEAGNARRRRRRQRLRLELARSAFRATATCS